MSSCVKCDPTLNCSFKYYHPLIHEFQTQKRFTILLMVMSNFGGVPPVETCWDRKAITTNALSLLSDPRHEFMINSKAYKVNSFMAEIKQSLNPKRTTQHNSFHICQKLKMTDTIPLSCFQVFPIPGDDGAKIPIKKFVTSHAKIPNFQMGSGFYQLSKPEVIQVTKRILVQRLGDPDKLLTGPLIRDVLKIDEKAKGGKFMVEQEILDEFRVFVQSTSHNRNLMGGTVFLYQKEGTDPFNAVPVPKISPKNKAENGNVDSSSHAPKRSRISNDGGSGSEVVEIVISFDTTGSMYPCLSTVRSVVRDTLSTLTKKIPNIRLGILAHGDYYDAKSSYVTAAANNYKFCSASESNLLIDFVTNVGSTCGGDAPECYELVLHEVATKYDWTEGSKGKRALILIGDDEPHKVNDNPKKLDWRVEARKLKEMGIKVYAIQALNCSRAESFYRGLSEITGGFHLRLYQFSAVTEFLVAVCYKEGDESNSAQNLTSYEEELTTSGKMVQHLRRLFDQLQGRSNLTPGNCVTGVSSSTSLAPVSPSRFQVLIVDEDKPIKKFAEERGLMFKAGRGFYEFTKPESISDKKEIILMEKDTEEFYTGWSAARELTGILPNTPKKQAPKGSEKYVVFVQSTSYNRKLLQGQKFLYEVDTDS